jgi:ribosomal protein S18 acetylase RimI-like enzyme
MAESPLSRIEAFRAAVGARTRAPGVLTYGTDPDLESFWGPWPVTNANTVLQPRIAPADAARRVAEVNAAYVARGMPFAWVLTPATTSPELEAALEAGGLRRETAPEVYADLLAPVSVDLPAGVVIEQTTDLDAVAAAIAEGFSFAGIPGVADGFEAYLDALDRSIQHDLLAWDAASGEVLGVGTLIHLDRTVQLVNIATPEAHRGRGVGSAVTAALMNLGRDLGADAAMLTATEMGYPIYRKLGFETVFELVRYEWSPPAEG